MGEEGRTSALRLDGSRPTLMLVTDRARLRGRALADVVDEAVAGGVTIVQLRDREATHTDLLRDARVLREVTRGRALLLVNSDVEAALAAGADGVHLPEHGATVANTRTRAGGRLLVSRAVHSAEAARDAARAGADLLVAGTVFDTASKPGAATLGADGLAAICASVPVPVIAIGGIAAGNVASAIEAGARGVAVIGATLDAPDARAAAADLRRALDAVASPTAGAR